MLCVSRLEWPVRTISFSHDGRMLASASEDLVIDIAEVESGNLFNSFFLFFLFFFFFLYWLVSGGNFRFSFLRSLHLSVVFSKQSGSYDNKC